MSGVLHMNSRAATFVLGVAIAAADLGASSAALYQASPSPPPPTFNRDVAPILFARCVGCHRAGEVAPMSLVTYDEARPWAQAIRRKVLAGEMPPWGADPKYGRFSNAPRMTDAERQTIAAWVDSGASQGDGAPPQAPPARSNGWSTAMGRPPDRIIEAPFGEFELPATGEVPLFAAWLRVPFRNDVFVEAMELLPTNRRVVHHAGISLGPLPPKTKIGPAVLWEGGPKIPGMRLDRDGRPYRTTSNTEFGYPLVFYVPGGGLLKLPDGVAKRLREGEYLTWGVHCVTTGRPERVGMRLGIWFARKPPHHEAEMMTANIRKFVDGGELAPDARGNIAIPPIPAGAGNWAITGSIHFPEAVTLYALWPHMHYRGKDMTFVLRRPDGSEETLLSVPRYDFNYQVTYELAEPLRIPPGSTILAHAHYDNSAANRGNPDPTQPVLWGEQSYNEMFNPFLEVSVDRNDLRFERLVPPPR